VSHKSNGASGAKANGTDNGTDNGTGNGADGDGNGVPSLGGVHHTEGTLIIIGGHEDKEGDRVILRALAAHAQGGALVVVTAASNVPDELWGDYEPLFRDLGVKDVRHLHVDTRAEAHDPERLRTLDGAAAVFFTGGNQLKLTSQLGDTPVYQRVRALYEGGGCVAGTSAGASVVSETMLVTGDSDASPKVGDAVSMAPGFGFLQGVIVDQHFAERGRIGRLIGAVAQNPRILGVGIDEDTAIVCEGGQFTVLGASGVYVVDGRDVSHSNVVDEARDRTLSVYDLRVHLLNVGDTFDLFARRPACRPAIEAEARLAGIGQESR
jgi:cyanophycinase